MGSAILKVIQALTSTTATWFCVQCLTRFAQGLAISLLELNTFGHAVCTLFIYFMWWNKPLDIQEPEQIIVKTPELSEFIAKMCREDGLEYTSIAKNDLRDLRLFMRYRPDSGKGWITHKHVSFLHTISEIFWGWTTW